MEGPYTYVIDLLADLRHYCAQRGHSFEVAMQISGYHFAAETGNPSLAHWCRTEPYGSY
jgi:hypothetical protein